MRSCLTFSSALFFAALLAAGCGDNMGGSSGGGATCGDGVAAGDEECDDGNTESGDGCSATCTAEEPPAGCGNGVVAGDEECDDGNTESGDGCSATCTLEGAVCGNGVLDEGEACDDGNEVALDGCESDCSASPEEVVCQELEPLPAGVCAGVPGSGGDLVLVGDVLTPSTILRGGQVRVDLAGQITCVGCDCGDPSADDAVVTCPRAVISPGLINPHDHITYAHNTPYADTGERYEHRHQWRRGLDGHTEIEVRSGASADQIRYGELRFVLGGATSVIGAGSATGFLRNLDTEDQEGLGQVPVELDVFPLGDGSGVLREEGCFYPSITPSDQLDGVEAYAPHVSEGIDLNARNEFICLSRDDAGGHDLLEEQSAFIHGAALNPLDYARMRDEGAHLIWSPRSNITLYGNTATVTVADRLGLPIALGTDWIATGSMNLLRELQCADQFNRDYLAGYFSDKDLWEMVTVRAAEAAAMDDAIGALLPGRVADIAIFDAAERADYRAIIDAAPEDVALVLRGGQPLYGDAAVVEALGGTTCDTLDVCSAQKRLCVESEIGMSLAELESAVGDMYPLFFCGTPDGEPTCVPSRPVSVDGSTVYTGVPSDGDADGDGIPDAEDNCADVFNPVRPVDGGLQADFDGDGEGDACDPCPLNPGTAECAPFDTGDPDADGVPTGQDLCPEAADPDQADTDGDLRGDACDACPMTANPAPVACPATIYEIKTGASRQVVSLTNQLVTACVDGNGFFIQVHPDDPGYTGPENSGLFVYHPDTACGVNVSPGDRVDITPSAEVGEFFGQIQLSFADVVVSASANPLPEPVLLSAAEAGGDQPNAYEGVLVRVEDVVVTDSSPPPGPGDSAPSNEFEVDGVLRVDDFIHLTASFPVEGVQYESITGVLAYRNNRQKIHPRFEADLVLGAPVLSAFGPALSYIRQGDVAQPTFPQPLAVTLSHAVGSDTQVTITSSDEAALTVVGGGVVVPAGETTATVLLNGLAPSPGVTLTATLGASTRTAQVRVLGGGEVPAIASLAPETATVPPSGTVTMTVTLDIPAGPGGATVSLASSPSNLGSVPPSVVVPEDELSASFDFTADATTGVATVTATLGASSDSSTITVAQTVSGLVINEVDYDQPGTDTTEFIEIFNYTGAAVDMSDYAIVLVNGSNSQQYARYNLSGTLGPDQFLVLGSPTVITSLPAGAIGIAFGSDNQLQNGAPEAVGLFQISTGQLVDALSYEGEVTAGSTDFGIQNFVEGTATGATDSGAGSLCRVPDGYDTGDAQTDWYFVATPTPGAPNLDP